MVTVYTNVWYIKHKKPPILPIKNTIEFQWGSSNLDSSDTYPRLMMRNIPSTSGRQKSMRTIQSGV